MNQRVLEIQAARVLAISAKPERFNEDETAWSNDITARVASVLANPDGFDADTVAWATAMSLCLAEP